LEIYFQPGTLFKVFDVFVRFFYDGKKKLGASLFRLVESSQTVIRVVGLSATLPNYIDVATFLRVNPYVGLFFFDGRFRPVPLAQTFIGIKQPNQMRQRQGWNSLTGFLVMASAHNLESSQTRVFVWFSTLIFPFYKMLFMNRLEQGTEFCKIRQSKRLRIAWSKGLESSVKLMSKNTISGHGRDLLREGGGVRAGRPPGHGLCPCKKCHRQHCHGSQRDGSAGWGSTF
jgi:hypothetical protein